MSKNTRVAKPPPRGMGFWSLSRSEWKRGRKPKWNKVNMLSKSLVLGMIEAIDPKKPSKGIKGDLAIGGAKNETVIKFEIGGDKKGALLIRIEAQSEPKKKPAKKKR